MAKQAPQPEQSVSLTWGMETPPIRGVTRTARGSQGSKQLRHSTPLKATQSSEFISATKFHGVSSTSFLSAPVGQAFKQSSQNRHSPALKLTSGNLPRPAFNMWVGQASMHREHESQASRKRNSSSAQGGRKGVLRPEKSPRKNCILLTAVDTHFA